MIKSENGIVTVEGENETLIKDLVCAAIATYAEASISYEELEVLLRNTYKMQKKAEERGNE